MCKECEICGVIIESSNPKQKYCEKCAVSPDRMRKRYETAVYRNKLRVGDMYKPVTVTCLACGQDFMTTYSDRRFCSQTCRKSYRYQTARCIECNELFSSKGLDKERGYCSDECRQAARLRRAKELGNYVPCKCCGTGFIRRSTTKVYCSKECREADKSLKSPKQASIPNTVKEKRSVPKGIRYVKCLCCGSMFDAALMINGEKYCSDACREDMLAESAKALKKATKQNKLSQAENICILCRTSQSKCERFTSEFVHMPTGAIQQSLDGKSVIVYCPKFS